MRAYKQFITHRRVGVAALALVALTGQLLNAQAGDAASGKEMLRLRGCTSCHPVAGQGSGSAPDLGQVAASNVSTAELAATMWNHGPKMWRAMDEQQKPIPMLTEFDIANLYAYLYSLRYFDPPGDAARGKKAFEDNRCDHCHFRGTVSAGQGAGPRVAAWVTMANRVDWVQQMWNHGAKMGEQLAARNLDWPEFTLQEMVDLLTYLEKLPELQLANPGLRMGDWRTGKDLFGERHCSQRHTLGEGEEGKIDLLEAARFEPRLSGLAVAKWNHRPKMEAEARKRGFELDNFETTEMEDLVAYLFKKGYFEQRGDARRGAVLIEEKGCGTCHGQEDSEAPALEGSGDGYSAVRFASTVWVHGPGMKDMMDYRNKDWPAMSAQDVADLVAYLREN